MSTTEITKQESDAAALAMTAGDAAMLSAVAKAELDQQIITARAHPRNIRKVIDEVQSLATLNESVAEECRYALPRKDKEGKRIFITGASVRFAEILASCWGNCRVASRIVEEGRQFVVAQGVFQDLERNAHRMVEVRRRITTAKGQRYSADMIGVTANAAASIAMREAVLKGVPKAFWRGPYEESRKCALGDVKTLASRRKDAMAYLKKLGVPEAEVLAVVDRQSLDEVTLDDLATLKGLCTAIKDGDTSVEDAFPAIRKAKDAGKTATDKLGDKLGAKEDDEEAKAVLRDAIDTAIVTLSAQVKQSAKKIEEAWEQDAGKSFDQMTVAELQAVKATLDKRLEAATREVEEADTGRDDDD